MADLWLDLREVGLCSADSGTLASPNRLREHCLTRRHAADFCVGFVMYWLFPTFHPSELLRLFGPMREPPGFEDGRERLRRLVDAWRPMAIVCFNGEVFESLSGAPSSGYLARLGKGLVEGQYRGGGTSCSIVQTYPAAWRLSGDATALRRSSLRRIRGALAARASSS